MSGTGTNDFLINNLDKLSTRYKLWHIKGLNRATERERNRNEYYQNRQYIINKLSFRLQQPVTIIEREETPYLVVPEEVMRMPTSLPLLRGRKAFFEPLPEIFELDYTKRSPENDTICLRFLEFRLQTPLHSHPELWQSKSGAPFFTRKVEGPDRPNIHYTGFAVRPVIAPDGGLALRVHIANKYVSREPLPTLLSHNDAWQWKRKHFIYHYGYLWYEINPTSLSDLNVSQYPVFTNDGVELPLLELAIRESKKPIPPELSLVEHNSAVLIYYNNRDEERSAISSLCYRVFGPHDAETKKLHRYSILPPGARRRMAMDFARRYLSRLKFGETSLEVDTEPISVPTRIFTMPDIRFGNAQVLSVRGTTGAHQTTLTELGAMRLNLLKDKKAGFYDARQLGRQYFIVPLSVYQSWGGSFLQGIGNVVDYFLHREDAYQPTIVSYNDLCPHTFLEQAKAILKVVGEQCDKPGHVLVMIHHLQSRKNHEEDPLAAMVVRELRSRFGLA